LTSTIDFYNLHQSIAKLDEKPLTMIVGGVRYTRNVQMLRRRYELEKGYGKTIYRSFNFSKRFFFPNPFFSSDLYKTFIPQD
jgi:hypothetical protein